jgi:hypothetical protein
MPEVTTIEKNHQSTAIANLIQVFGLAYLLAGELGGNIITIAIQFRLLTQIFRLASIYFR